ncbi:MTC6 [Candida oxycetoniae]|uniref:Maintenance of telomere capping protein 6 n=1 Tax=Candida oxycetoniae TaxID=497107 RepID=A0AAI9WXY9_9ASCO|nr:MTC6 [Candida oxycetoniae]KAI3404275.2 MTC6 [Candida oxycetoniae]
MQVYIKFLLILSFALNLAFCDLSPQETSTTNRSLDIAYRAQRDVSRPIPIDQQSSPGFSLNSLFENKGYTMESVSNLTELLQLGARTISIDLYWNEFTSIWQLCPAPFPKNMTYDMNNVMNLTWENKTYTCQVGLTTNNIMSSLYNFISSTNTKFDANFFHLILNLKSIHYEKSNRTMALENIYFPNSEINLMGNSTLGDILAPISSYIFTPEVLASYRERKSAEVDNSESQVFYAQSNFTMPSLNTVLFGEYKRLLVNVLSNELVDSRRVYKTNSQDEKTIFLKGTLPSTVFSSAEADAFCAKVLPDHNSRSVIPFNDTISFYNNISLSTHFRYVIDSDAKPFALEDLSRYVRCGLSPILNAKSYHTTEETLLDVEHVYRDFASYFFWSWKSGEPRISSESTDLSRSSSDGSNVAYKCVVLNVEGWDVADCYTEYQIACQNQTGPNDWYIPPHNRKNYFEIDKDDCPPGYSLGVPRSSFEMAALYSAILDHDATIPVWIDLNDITVSSCFVSGGPYAQCPYQRTVTTTKFARMIAPSSIVSLVILILIFLEKILRKNTLQTNRKKYWKKVIAEHYSKHEYEGVPS